MKKRLEVHFFRLLSGKEPVREWLLGLSQEERKSIGVDLKTVEWGWPVGMPVCKPLGTGLYEVRSSMQNGQTARVLFMIEGNMMILLHGFIKKTQKTPNRELAIAHKRFKEIKNYGKK